MRALLLAAVAAAGGDATSQLQCTLNCLPTVRVTGGGVEVVRYYC
jgi:hypothetical protein